MKLTYTNNLPLIRIKVIGRGEREVNSHVDFASSKTVIPTKLAEEMKLVFAGFDLTATGAGVVPMPTYRATVQLLGKSFGFCD